MGAAGGVGCASGDEEGRRRQCVRALLLSRRRHSRSAAPGGFWIGRRAAVTARVPPRRRSGSASTSPAPVSLGHRRSFEGLDPFDSSWGECDRAPRADRRDPLVAKAGAPPDGSRAAGRSAVVGEMVSFRAVRLARSVGRRHPVGRRCIEDDTNDEWGPIERTPDVLSRRKAGARVGWKEPRRRA